MVTLGKESRTRIQVESGVIAGQEPQKKKKGMKLECWAAGETDRC